MYLCAVQTWLWSISSYLHFSVLHTSKAHFFCTAQASAGGRAHSWGHFDAAAQQEDILHLLSAAAIHRSSRLDSGWQMQSYLFMPQIMQAIIQSHSFCCSQTECTSTFSLAVDLFFNIIDIYHTILTETHTGSEISITPRFSCSMSLLFANTGDGIIYLIKVQFYIIWSSEMTIMLLANIAEGPGKFGGKSIWTRTWRLLPQHSCWEKERGCASWTAACERVLSALCGFYPTCQAAAIQTICYNITIGTGSP